MFKYHSFSEYSLANILNSEIYLNHYEFFNDPFECRCEVIEGFPKRDPSCARFQKIVRAWGFDDANDQNVIDYYDDYASSLEHSQPSITTLLDSARISCFSKKGDNLLMWSHYADGLRGFCIEFDPVLLLTNCSEATEIYDVRYENVPAVIDTALIAVLNDQVDYHGGAIFAFEQDSLRLGVNRSSEIKAYSGVMDDALKRNREIYQQMLATKPIEWGYEEEVRIISDSDKRDKAGDFLKYPPDAIKSVIIGERMPMHQRRALMKAIENNSSPISLKIASRVNGKFNIVLGAAI